MCIFIKHLRYGHCLKMGTYLQLPVLRITKYHLLLQRYLKLLLTTQHSSDLSTRLVGNALTLMKQVNDQINRDMPQEESESCKDHHHQRQQQHNHLSSSDLVYQNDEELPTTIDMSQLIKLFGHVLKQVNS